MSNARLRALLCALVALQSLPANALADIVRDRHYRPLHRVAALRWLIRLAPPDVTGGLSYADRRRAAREHFGL